MDKKKDNRRQVNIDPILHEKLKQLVDVANKNIKVANEDATTKDKIKITGMGKIVNSLIEDYLTAKVLTTDGIKLKEPYYFFIDELIEKKTVTATKEKKNYNINNQIVIYYAPNNLDSFSLNHLSYCYNENKNIHKGIIEFPVVDTATNEVTLYFLIITLTLDNVEVEIATGSELTYILNDANPDIQKEFNSINISFNEDVTKFKEVYELVFTYAPLIMLRPITLDNLFLNYMLLQDKLQEKLIEDSVEMILTTAEGVEIPFVSPPNYMLNFAKDFILTVMANDGNLNYWFKNESFKDDGAEVLTSNENLFLNKFWKAIAINNNFAEFYKKDNVAASLDIILSNNFGTADISEILEKYKVKEQE